MSSEGKKKGPAAADQTQAVLDLLNERHTPEMVAELERGLREHYFERMHPNYRLLQRTDVGGPEHMMWLFEKMDPIELQRNFLLHVGRVGIVPKSAVAPTGAPPTGRK